MKSYFLPDFHYRIYCKAKIEKKCGIRKFYIWILSTLCVKDVFTIPLKGMKLVLMAKDSRWMALGHVIV